MTQVTGASRSGKSADSIQRTREHPRLVVWDPDGDWASDRNGPGKCRLIQDPKELLTALFEDARSGPARIAFQVDTSAKMFDWFCRAAWSWGLLGELDDKRTTIVVDELSDVTSPGKAPFAWGRIVKRGLKHGISVIGITQRPTESDKTLVGNTQIIRCFRMQRAADREYMAREMNGPTFQEISDLKNLEYFECWPGDDSRSGYSRGKVTF